MLAQVFQGKHGHSTMTGKREYRKLQGIALTSGARECGGTRDHWCLQRGGGIGSDVLNQSVAMLGVLSLPKTPKVLLSIRLP